MRKDLEHSLSENTHRSYQRAWGRFQSFMNNTLDRHPCPAQSHDVGLYVTHLHSLGLTATSIRTHLSAIAFYHKIDDHKNPTDSFLIQKLLISYSKSDQPPSVRLPIQSTLLHKIISSIDGSTSSPYEIYLLTAIFSTMYHGALRIGEVCKSQRTKHTLQLSQINVKTYRGKQYMSISFITHKHSQSRPPKAKIHGTSGQHCPVTIMQRYLHHRGKAKGPLFITKGGRPVSRSLIKEALDQQLQILGYNSLLYNTHSFRIGKATDMAKAGCTATQISLAGRWKSSAYQRYIKLSHINMNPPHK